MDFYFCYLEIKSTSKKTNNFTSNSKATSTKKANGRTKRSEPKKQKPIGPIFKSVPVKKSYVRDVLLDNSISIENGATANQSTENVPEATDNTKNSDANPSEPNKSANGEGQSALGTLEQLVAEVLAANQNAIGTRAKEAGLFLSHLIDFELPSV